MPPPLLLPPQLPPLKSRLGRLLGIAMGTHRRTHPEEANSENGAHLLKCCNPMFLSRTAYSLRPFTWECIRVSHDSPDRKRTPILLLYLMKSIRILHVLYDEFEDSLRHCGSMTSLKRLWDCMFITTVSMVSSRVPLSVLFRSEL